MLPRFDADTAALVERSTVNAGRSRHDLDQWIIGQLHLAEGMRILDLGCGTGKQIFSLAPLVGRASNIVGVDISPEAVAAVNERAEGDGWNSVRAVRASFDDWPEFLDLGPFDLILSAYAVYYASDMTALLVELAEALVPGGQLFVCGPGRGTNQEIIDIINEVARDDGLRVPQVEDFVDQELLSVLQSAYAEVSTSRLANNIKFLSLDEVLQWWRSHNAFRPQLEDEVSRRVEGIVAKEGHFTLTKNVLGLRCRAC